MLISHFIYLRPSDVGKVLTWNIGAAYTKFKIQGGEAIKNVLCSYIGKADIVAFQEAAKFDCSSFDDFKVHQSEQFITMVKTKDINPITHVKDLKLEPNKPTFAVAVKIMATNVNKGKSVAVVNVQFASKDFDREKQIKATVKFIKEGLKGKFDMIIVLGDFFKYTNDQLTDLLGAIDNNAKPAIDLDSKAPITTVDGGRFDNVLISDGEVKKLNLPRFPYPADGSDPRFSNMYNNYVILDTYGKDPTNVKLCMDEYVEKQTTDSAACAQLWVSSRMISDHLPLQLKVRLVDDMQEETELSVGTWNIEHDHLVAKLADPDTATRMEAVTKKFNILVFQELVVDGPKLNIHQVDTKDPGEPEHGFFLKERSNVKLQVEQGDISHFKVGQNSKSVCRIPVNIEVNSKDNYKICFYSIHFPGKGMKQEHIKAELKELEKDAQSYKSCQFSLALGDFNSLLSKWPKTDPKKEGLNDPVS